MKKHGQLMGTAMELGDAMFRNCALPSLAHLANQMNAHLPDQVAAEQRVLMWAGFFSSAIGCMGADCGKAAVEALANQLVDVAAALIPETAKEQRH